MNKLVEVPSFWKVFNADGDKNSVLIGNQVSVNPSQVF